MYPDMVFLLVSVQFCSGAEKLTRGLTHQRGCGFQIFFLKVIKDSAKCSWCGGFCFCPRGWNGCVSTPHPSTQQIWEQANRWFIGSIGPATRQRLSSHVCLSSYCVRALSWRNRVVYFVCRKLRKPREVHHNKTFYHRVEVENKLYIYSWGHWLLPSLVDCHYWNYTKAVSWRPKEVKWVCI